LEIFVLLRLPLEFLGLLSRLEIFVLLRLPLERLGLLVVLRFPDLTL